MVLQTLGLSVCSFTSEQCGRNNQKSQLFMQHAYMFVLLRAYKTASMWMQKPALLLCSFCCDDITDMLLTLSSAIADGQRDAVSVEILLT